MPENIVNLVEGIAPLALLARLGLCLLIARGFYHKPNGKARLAMIVIFIILAFGSFANLLMYGTRVYYPSYIESVRFALRLVDYVTIGVLVWLWKEIR